MKNSGRTGATMRVLLMAGSAMALATTAQAQSAVEAGTVKVEGRGPEGFTILTTKDEGYRARRTGAATKTDTDLIDVPQAVTVVTGEQIEDQAITSMADAVRYVPGVTFAQGEGNRDTPVFRGNASTADFFIDGIRDDVQFFRDVYNIDRVEVLKGPNGLIFGRGGSGGVINRVTKQANWNDLSQVHFETGSYDQIRGTVDLNRALSDSAALRLTGLYEDTDTYRDGVSIERWGLNPTASFLLDSDTVLTVGYEHFEDDRTADRGVPSLAFDAAGNPVAATRDNPGRPVPGVDSSTFFGDPDNSPVTAQVDAISAAIEHRFGNGIMLRNKTRYADYDKFYQNVFPGAVNLAPVTIGGLDYAPGTAVTISAYNNATQRENFINQTDLTAYFDTGSVKHTLLAGIEYSHQKTDNFRATGYFTDVSPTTTSILVPVADPHIDANLTWRQSASDADNHGVVEGVGAYLQDQIELSDQFQVILGIRYDNIDVDFTNNRTGLNIQTTDNLWSPRAGLVYKPMENLALYASYSKTYVPRAGEQLASLSLTNANLDPEEFENYEIGAKWDVLPELSLTAAVYQLDRSNVVIPDPADPTLSILVDGQRTRGFEFSLSGQVTQEWTMIGSYSYQDAEVTETQSATILDGNQLANAPKHLLALWNRYQITPEFGAAVGIIHQSKRFASADNFVELKSFTRVDAALFYDIGEQYTVQVNVENVFDENYYSNAHSNNNLTPGAPLAVKVGLTANF